MGGRCTRAARRRPASLCSLQEGRRTLPSRMGKRANAAHSHTESMEGGSEAARQTAGRFKADHKRLDPLVVVKMHPLLIHGVLVSMQCGRSPSRLAELYQRAGQRPALTGEYMGPCSREAAFYLLGDLIASFHSFHSSPQGAGAPLTGRRPAWSTSA